MLECPDEGMIVLTLLVCVLTLTVTVKGSISEEQHYQLFKDGSLSGTLSCNNGALMMCLDLIWKQINFDLPWYKTYRVSF